MSLLHLTLINAQKALCPLLRFWGHTHEGEVWPILGSVLTLSGYASAMKEILPESVLLYHYYILKQTDLNMPDMAMQEIRPMPVRLASVFWFRTTKKGDKDFSPCPDRKVVITGSNIASCFRPISAGIGLLWDMMKLYFEVTESWKRVTSDFTFLLHTNFHSSYHSLSLWNTGISMKPTATCFARFWKEKRR